jgi:hypothetical protein
VGRQRLAQTIDHNHRRSKRLFEKFPWLPDKAARGKLALLISEDLERLGRPLKWLYIGRKRSFPDFSNSL